MRAGGCMVQQSLTSEAAGVVKQAITLAGRRGHAQVTPLHVASTMLALSAGPLRTACLRSHSHPLQCKALELCFNVALNRLPSSAAVSGSSILGPAHSPHGPSISNALLAAFKRAQAHQRRGGPIEAQQQQQQPIMAVKIELGQLIVSILDDPSVSRVMREAGFSSTQVKSNVEQVSSVENQPQSQPPIQPFTIISDAKPNIESNNALIRNDDVISVIESLVVNKRRRKRSTVVVGECVATMESVVKAVMDKVEKGDVPEALMGLKFVGLNMGFSSNGIFSREGVERKLGELRSLLMTKSCVVGSEVVLYLGDLNWTNYYDGSADAMSGPLRRHMVIEIGKLVCVSNGESSSCRFRIMGIASLQTYMKCRNGNPSVESLWGLHPLIIPVGSLGLSLIPTDSDLQSQSKKGRDHEGSSSWLLHDEDEEHQHQTASCADFSPNFVIAEAPRRTLHDCSSASNIDDSTSSSLPLWLQKYKDENNALVTSNNQNCVTVGEVCRNRSSICSRVIGGQPNCSSERTLTFSSSPSPSSSNPVSSPHSASSSGFDPMETDNHFAPHGLFKGFNPENLQTLTTSLQNKVPWQRDVIPEIATIILQCRSGMIERRGTPKEDTWLFFQGMDSQAKERVAVELARVIFGSENAFVSIALSSFTSSSILRNKRYRDEESCCSYLEKLAEGVSDNPHRVFFIEDVEQADYRSVMGIKRAMEKGRIKGMNPSDEEVCLSDGIVILSSESFRVRSRGCSPSSKQRLGSDGSSSDGDEVNETSRNCVSLDLNISICEYEDEDEDERMDGVGLVKSVDKVILFNIREL